MDNSLPVFIDLPEKEQAEEIRQYLISAGADLPASGKESIYEELSSLLDACDNWLKSASDADLEAMMNSFISLILYCTFDDKLTRKFCSKLTEIGASANNALLRIKILNNLFVGLPTNNPLRCDVYISQLRLACMFGHADAIETQLKKVKDWLDVWGVDMEQRRICYRQLHGALKDQQRSDEATRVMLELLSTYDEASASLAKEDAENCVIDYISRADIFIMDHLLKLKPVTVLQDQPIYQLLEIFVSGSLADYLEFYSNNEEYIKEKGLNHEENVHKMRILTTLTLCSTRKEIPYSQLTELLGISELDLEEFIIDVVKSKLVHAKIDQINERIIIRSASVRTFGKKEWMQIEQKLEAWYHNMQSIRTNLEQVVQVGAG